MVFTKKISDVDRLMSHVRIEQNGCWTWTAAAMSGGYAVTSFGSRSNNSRKMVYAHRLMYELIKGKVPSDLQLDHLCRNRLCINPDHLEAVTARVNQIRGNTFAAQNIRKSHCKRGHPFDLLNTEFYMGKRRCRECRWLDYVSTNGRGRKHKAVRFTTHAER